MNKMDRKRYTPEETCAVGFIINEWPNFYSLVFRDFFIKVNIFMAKLRNKTALMRIIRFEAKKVMMNEKGSGMR